MPVSKPSKLTLAVSSVSQSTNRVFSSNNIPPLFALELAYAQGCVTPSSEQPFISVHRYRSPLQRPEAEPTETLTSTNIQVAKVALIIRITK